MSVAEIMTHPVTTLGMDDPIRLAGAHFESGGFHHLPVVDTKKRVLGIISDRDYLNVTSPYMNTPSELNRDLEFMSHKVHTIMTRNPACVQRDVSIGEAAKILTENKFSSLLVIDENEVLRGIVTWKDLIKFLSRFPDLDLSDGVLSVCVNEEEASTTGQIVII